MDNQINIPEISKIKKLFAEKKILFAYFFGSRATGNATENSDYDFAIFFSERTSENERFKARCKLMSQVEAILKKPSDVLSLNDTKGILLKFSIIKERKVIFEKNHSKRLDFEVKTMNDYYDFSPFIDEYNKAYLKRKLKK